MLTDKESQLLHLHFTKTLALVEASDIWGRGMSPGMESEVPEENGVKIQLFSSVDTTTDRKS